MYFRVCFPGILDRSNNWQKVEKKKIKKVEESIGILLPIAMNKVEARFVGGSGIDL